MLCWYLKHLTQDSHQKVLLELCDISDIHQKFNFHNGRLFPSENPELCVGLDPFRRFGSLVASRCFHNTFFVLDGNDVQPASPFAEETSLLRPFGLNFCVDVEGSKLVFNDCENESGILIARSQVYRQIQTQQVL